MKHDYIRNNDHNDILDKYDYGKKTKSNHTSESEGDLISDQAAALNDEKIGLNEAANTDTTRKTVSNPGAGTRTITVSVNKRELEEFRDIVGGQPQKTISAVLESMLKNFVESNPEIPTSQIIEITGEKRRANKEFGASSLSAKVDQIVWKEFVDICDNLGIKNAVVIYILIKEYNDKYRSLIFKQTDKKSFNFSSVV